MEVLNIALVLKGGIGYKQIVPGENCFVVYKENISNLDFIELGNFVSPEVHEYGNEKNKSGIGGGGVFEIDGITVGLEICLDHTKGRLSKEQIDVHLVCSAGMAPYNPGENVPKLAFYLDGAKDQGGVYRNGELQSETGGNYRLLKQMKLGELRNGNPSSAPLKDLFHRLGGESYSHDDSVKGGFLLYPGEYRLGT